MSILIRRLIIVVLGLLGGLAAWPLIELLLVFQAKFPSYFLFSLVQGIVLGAVLGAFFGSGEGLTSKEKGKIIRGTLTGLATGIVGGSLGFLAGQGLLFLALQYTSSTFRTHQLLVLPLARLLGWAILGIAIGASEGIRARSVKKIALGSAGGLLGGLVGGAAMEYLRALYPSLIYARLVGLLLFGLFISLFYAIIERRISIGRLRVLNGSKKGKEYSLAQNRLSLGSGPRNDIVLQNYKGVEPRHLRFKLKGKDVYLEKEKSAAKVYINEKSVQDSRLLKYDDVIQVGSAKMIYRTE